MHSGLPVRSLLKLAWLVLTRRVGTRALYDAFSRDYDTLVHYQPETTTLRAFLEHYIASRGVAARSVLETGCGTGLLSRQLVDLAGELHGVDFSRGQLLRAQEKGLPIGLTQGDVVALPFRDGQFDMVVSLELLPHLPGREAVYCAEAYRVLRPGGVLVLDMLPGDHERRGPPRRGRLLRTLANTVLTGLLRFEVWRQPPSTDYLLSAARQAGFEAELHVWDCGRTWRLIIGRKPPCSGDSGDRRTREA